MNRLIAVVSLVLIPITISAGQDRKTFSAFFIIRVWCPRVSDTK
jgi:hypothetical protein